MRPKRSVTVKVISSSECFWQTSFDHHSPMQLDLKPKWTKTHLESFSLLNIVANVLHTQYSFNLLLIEQCSHGLFTHFGMEYVHYVYTHWLFTWKCCLLRHHQSHGKRISCRIGPACVRYQNARGEWGAAPLISSPSVLSKQEFWICILGNLCKGCFSYSYIGSMLICWL